MDGDLFQGVLLGLLAIGVIVLAALLATLGGIRKALEQRASQAGSPQYTGLGLGADPGTSAHDLGASGAQPVSTAGTAGGQASQIRGVLEQHGLQQAQETPASSTPADAAAPAAGESAAQQNVVDSVFAAHADDPQEEPFQRDGRWWFRRGDELLLYDEATGQWQPAPDKGPGAGSPAGSAAAVTQTQPAATTTAQAAPAAADAVANYWKCPTCGAVNGSTAATCRMCFAARP